MNEEKDNKLVIWGAIAMIVILGLWSTTYFLLKDLEPADRGTYGDMFGAVNALFSGFALAGIIFTILLQRKELDYQRKELEATRLEFKIQNGTLRLQRFENTFFNLLNVHHKLVETIDFDTQVKKKVDRIFDELTNTDYEIVTIKSRDVFKYMYDALVNELRKEDNENLNESYLKFYETVQTDFGHYFRNLYRIIKFVHETDFFSKEDLDISPDSVMYRDLIKYNIANHNARYNYTSMIRAQLSDYELLWIFYNCLSINGHEKFKPLIEEYSLLKNLPQSKIHSVELVDRYEKSAFSKK
jgi:Putative phage abortive infection protein